VRTRKRAVRIRGRVPIRSCVRAWARSPAEAAGWPERACAGAYGRSRAMEAETGRFLAAWMHVRQVVQAANFNRFHKAGLSATQFMTLNVIPKEGLTLTQLARRLNLSSASLKKTVDSLEERGLVSRRRSVEDARKVDILNTLQGTRLQNTASGEFHRFMVELFTAMPEAERRGLLTGLERMVKLSPLENADSSQERTTPHAEAAPRGKHSSRRSVAR